MMRKQAKRVTALVLCVMLFATLFAAQSFAEGKDVDAFYRWYNRAHQDYVDSVIRNPQTIDDYRTNMLLKYHFLVAFNQHQAEAAGEIIREAIELDEETYLRLVAEQELKRQEFIQYATEYQAAADAAVRMASEAREDAWQSYVNGEIPSAGEQYRSDEEQISQAAQAVIGEIEADAAATYREIDEDSEAIARERERRLRALLEEMERLRRAQPNTIG